MMPGLYGEDELQEWRRRVDAVYARREAGFGQQRLAAIGDRDVARAPLLYDFEFTRMAAHPRVLALMQRVLGEWFILNVQNAIINRPSDAHHQAAWHRDLPYQNYVITRPLAISCLVTLDAFSEATGGTQVLPFTHKTEVLPSTAYISKHRLTAAAPAGSAIIFDAMLFHRAGSNGSQQVRRGVNHVYSTPILKQNYDFPRALGARADLSPALERLLGYSSQVPVDERAWRDQRAARLGVH
ncbi:phytanoyl-CoA dioxygenase family protein [Ramlibacter terrae]|uniref:Phytanoyl-CoA dioxygenase family protein n=1 Tax=Ramlibacter terrae TaxID=2732511 RepID=A0ABX6P3B4_9BURK|nr:phytanoyl-CoA dioxygenase family protein [Ramlibacter terrae]